MEKNKSSIDIKKAGSEGIDFKNIRQIHIMDPWYNMSRIEQIIGRGVRYKSHCNLPFEKRNVEIFLHSTLLEDKSQESADMYVYRLSEKKSIKIGKITRMLKELAIDCKLNIEQTNLTKDDLLTIPENKDIKIILSNRKEKTINYGHKEHTAICDYMDNCKFKCNISKEENEDNSIIDVNYNDEFIVMNNDIIMKRIKDIFREIPEGNSEKHFISIEDLIKNISISKNYPIEQIYHILNYFINNKEPILDKYGRKGYLINKGNYYIFQPKEITDDRVSLLERYTPIDIKNKKISIDLSKTKLDKIETVDNFENTMKNITDNFNTAFNNNENVNSNLKDWYKIFSSLILHFVNEYSISLENLKKYVMIHIINTLKFSEKMLILNKIYKTSSQKEVEIYIQKYFQSLLILNDEGTEEAFTFSEDQTQTPKVFIRNSENIFEESQFSKSKNIYDSKLYREKLL